MEEQRFGPPHVVDLPPLHVACYRAVSQSPEEDGQQFLSQWLKAHGVPEPARQFGFDADVTPDQQQAGQRGYELWAVVPAEVQAEGPVSLRDYPGGRYASLTIYHPFDDPFTWIPAGHARLRDWVMANATPAGDMWECLEELVPGEEGDDLVIYHAIAG